MSEQEASHPEKFSPKKFLRSRRPERFSDSVRQKDPALNRTLLEYHLDTLTSRNQETEFERFALAVAQKTVCPNLRPQTGPTGGGDAKVDSETFPIADQLALAWFIGEPAAATERWAFAFSAKKEWAPKVRSDIGKIAETHRGYTRAYFISNQFISDRNRSKEEDSLSQKFGFRVIILDRTWILDQVFFGNLQNLAIDILRISVPISDSFVIGHADAKRKSDLEKIERQIVEQVQSNALGPALADDCLRSAIISRAIEVPDADLDGRFARAASIAEKHGTLRQRIEVAYQRAWTAYWWQENYEKFSTLYIEVEGLVFSSGAVESLQLLHNLWFLLFSISKIDESGPNRALINTKTIALADALNAVANREDLPNGSLQARSMMAVQQIAMTLPDPPENSFKILHEIIQESEGLIGFPIKALVESLTEIGQFFVGNTSYDALFEFMLDVASRRSGEISKGKMLLDRGIQLAAEKRFYDAIRSIGRCLILFAKEETADELILALFVSGHCYQQNGLLWAARSSFLNAAALILREFDKHADVSYFGNRCFDTLKWVELSLGRIGSVLMAHKMDLWWRNSMASGPIEFEPQERDHQFDLCLGVLLLSASPSQLKLMERLPDVLGRLALNCGRDALLHALGHETSVSSLREQGDNESIHDFFLKWRHQPASDELAQLVVFYEGTGILNSQILGCDVTVKFSLEGSSMEFSESLLAALEAILSTGMKERLFAVESRLTIVVAEKLRQDYPFAFELDDSSGIPIVKILLSSTIRSGMSREQQNLLNDKMCDLVLHIFLRVWRSDDIDAAAARLFGEQRALERALSIAGNLIVSEKILGNDSKASLEVWYSEKDKTYHLARQEPWDSKGPDDFDLADWISTKGGNRVVASDGEGLDQRRFKTKSLIRPTLWDRAKWKGIAFFYGMEARTIPMMGLMFENEDAASGIFRGLVEDVGNGNRDNYLRITVVKGVLISEPYVYRLAIGCNWDNLTNGDIFGIMARVHTMNPRDDKNIKMFLGAYAKCGSFVLTYANAPTDPSPPKPNHDNVIRIDSLNVREAWTIGLNDPDMMAITRDDNPIIPVGESAPPVQKLLEFLRSRP